MNLIELAKLAVETFVKENKIISLPEDLPLEFSRSKLAQLLKRRAGTFVTIEEDGKLRGCIGTYLPLRQNIAKEVISNAIAAATEDYRFGSIKEEELPHLSYTVYILNEPELVKDYNPPTALPLVCKQAPLKELNPKKYGVVVKTVPITSPDGTDVIFNGHFVPKTGLLLPDLEGIGTIEKQISIACRKGRIDPLREKIIIYKFTVEKYQ
ncbi:AMMECR1 domain-containing protein [Patescibacteria group bacterium]|nr:AMMECR1 domain-containing protein [Patescibacteria group bacterium]